MANIKSQIKRNLTNEKARLRNREVRSEVKTAIRSLREQIAAGDAASARSALQLASRKLDKAVSKGVLHKNNAANRKSSLAKQVNALDALSRFARLARRARARSSSEGRARTDSAPADPPVCWFSPPGTRQRIRDRLQTEATRLSTA